jgi:hypothetical protein
VSPGGQGIGEQITLLLSIEPSMELDPTIDLAGGEAAWI